jgi:two-component system, sensor histidine kinase and response regulator
MAQQFGRQFQVVFEHSPIGIVVMDGSGRIQYSNNAVRSFLGYPEEELSGGFLTSFSYQEDSEYFQTLFSEVVSGERDRFQVVSRCRTRSEAIAWWRVDITQVTAGGHTPFILAVIDDVTSQKNDEDRLRRAKELAEAATRTKSAFLANMSHEIRTPLHTINAVADLLRETNLDEEQEEYLEQILFAGEVLLGLINDILDFSKIEAGRLQLEHIEYDPVKTVEDAVDMVSMQAHRKGLEVILAIDRRMPRRINGDPNRMRQVLVNLVNNAVKFTEKGHIRIDAGFREVRSGPRLLVQVRDTGIGIDPDRQDRLFKPFSQVDASMTRKFGGTGLGLSISRDLIQMMGGGIGVKSRPAKGSNFWFTLPLNEVREEDLDALAPREMPHASRALIVDDNRESARIIRRYLEEWRIDVENATGAGVGLQSMRAARSGGHPFTFVLIDLQLPDMDGWQLASEIRNDAELDSMPLILMSPTGLSTGEAKMKLLRWFDAYISKPVKRGDLVSALEGIFVSDLEELEAVPEREGIDLPVEGDTDGYPETVLIAEDHFVNQQLFQTILQKRGFNTIVASDGVEAVRCVEQHPEIGLVFMDVQMPNLNGYDATTRIRKLGYQVPIVAVTANALSGDRDRCVRVGMDDYMSKPFKSADIGVILERLSRAGAFKRVSALGRKPIGEGTARIHGADRELDDRELDDRELEKEEPTMSDPADNEQEQIPIDIASTIDAFMGDVETAERVTLQFADRLPDQLKQLQEYLQTGKTGDARVTSHAIKGGAWNLTAMPLGAAAKAVEDACAAEDEESALQLLPALSVASDSFIEYVRAIDFTST